MVGTERLSKKIYITWLFIVSVTLIGLFYRYIGPIDGGGLQSSFIQKPFIENVCKVLTFKLSSMKPDSLNLEQYKDNIEYAVEHFYRYTLQYIDAHCSQTERAGNLLDGGWDICVAPPYRPVANACVVLSFGINNDFSFDDYMALCFNCTVHSFDPSMNLPNHNRSSGVRFYNYGLSDKDETTENGWVLYTLKSILKFLDLVDKPIDVLKFDIEDSTTPALINMLKQGTLGNVKQLLFEQHSFVVKEDIEAVHILAGILDSLRKSGFRRFKFHENLQSVAFKSAPETPVDRPVDIWNRAYATELYYINSNMLDRKCRDQL